MVDAINLLANTLAIIELAFFITLVYLVLKVFQKIGKKASFRELLPFFLAITGYALYRLLHAFASLPEPRQDYFTIILAANFFLAITGLSFFIGASKILKNSRRDIDGRVD
ncbi:MAG: hypothetical protein QT12_C0019G0009 [archaeon GW2011_AR21]|nr:MAG: hypothetical protein QT12_C0019G0009 [archaeon GW2011_AR21]HIH32951.1 hypothetical protein [Candidatus Diapherotrites archaeon]